MCEDKENLGQINILVKLSTSLERFTGEKSNNGKDLQSHLQRYLSDLLFDLELPIDIQLTIDVDRSESKSEMEPYQVIIGNRKCRIALPTEVPDKITTIELARLLARDIYKNRELFITIPVSVTLNRFLSSSKSNPISDPSGTITFLSIIVRLILEWRPISQLSIIIESVI